MKTINDYAYHSKIKNIHPILKLILGMIPIFMVLLLNSLTVSLFVLAVMGGFTVANCKISVTRYLKLLLLPIAFLLLGILPIIFSLGQSGDTLFSIAIGNLTIYCQWQNLLDGLLLFFKALSAVSCMYFIALNTTMNDLIYAFKKMKAPMLFISLMELIYRYIFVLLEEYKKIFVAQRSRLGYKNFKTSIVSTGRLIAALFLKTYNKCDRVYNALLSRAYAGEIPALEHKYEKSLSMYMAAYALPLCIAMVFLLEKRWMHCM